nr:MAG TPA: hypothetical protein [Caudoviricetes sp.]
MVNHIGHFLFLIHLLSIKPNSGMLIKGWSNAR